MNILKTFFSSSRGSAMPIVALGMMMLIGSTGVAVDMGRVQIVQSRMQNALDSAGLAAGATVSTTNASAVVNQYFYANFPANYLGTTITALSVTPNSDNSMLALAVTGTVNTTFLQIFNIKTINVSAASQITRQSSGMELVLVLDNTGSMNSPVNPSNSNTPKIAALQSASATLLNTIYGATANTVPNLWVGVVPFSQAVNIGTGYTSWMDSAFDAPLDFGPTINNNTCVSWTGTTPATAGTYNANPGCVYKVSSTTNHTPPVTNFGMTGWAGCVMARPSPYNLSDDPPSTSLFQAYNYPAGSDAGVTYDPWVSSKITSKKVGATTTYTDTTTYNFANSPSLGVPMGPNVLCPQSVLPMVAEKSTVLSKINALTAGGSTLIDIGMAWGQRMLSPRWQGLWGGEMNGNKLPLAYNTPLMNKVVILMTDGMNSFSPGNFTAYKYLDSNVLGTTNETNADSDLDANTLAVCKALKANGVIIYTIGFGTNDSNNPSDPTSVNGPMLSACASKPSYYFLAPTNAELTSAFQQIGDSLANLRVSQ